jgi:hypothetical protein
MRLRDDAPAGAETSPRLNDHELEAGETGRTLANGDVMQVISVNGDATLEVRHRAGRDSQTGRARWAHTSFPYGDAGNSDLAYAVAGHSAQGLAVSHGADSAYRCFPTQHGRHALTRLR